MGVSWQQKTTANGRGSLNTSKDFAFTDKVNKWRIQIGITIEAKEKAQKRGLGELLLLIKAFAKKIGITNRRVLLLIGRNL